MALVGWMDFSGVKERIHVFTAHFPLLLTKLWTHFVWPIECVPCIQLGVNNVRAECGGKVFKISESWFDLPQINTVIY